ncbi:MAG: Rieske 2Fe-2S domain-containing protein [Frankiaceae bacterium]
MPQLVTLESVERDQRLDPVADKLRTAVRAVLRRNRAVKDALHGTWLGHPVHPLLVQVPIGAWVSAGLLDALPGSGKAPSRLIAAGVLAALPAATTGLTDWSELHPEQARVGLVHATSNYGALGCYLLSLRARRRGHGLRGRLLGYAGLALVTTGGAIGGHLSYRQAAGVNHAEQVPHLVPPGWHDVAAASELEEGRPIERELGGVRIMLLRKADVVHALANHCSHLSGPLHEGELTHDRAGEPCVSCPWHGSTFRLRDGSVVHGPATAPQPAFETRIVGDRVEVMLPGAG